MLVLQNIQIQSDFDPAKKIRFDSVHQILIVNNRTGNPDGFECFSVFSETNAKEISFNFDFSYRVGHSEHSSHVLKVNKFMAVFSNEWTIRTHLKIKSCHVNYSVNTHTEHPLSRRARGTREPRSVMYWEDSDVETI